MKIVYLYHSLAAYAGTERILADKMNLLTRHYGYEVYFITSDQGSHPMAFEMDSRIRIIDLGIYFYRRFRYNAVRRPFEYRRMIKLYVARLEECLMQIEPDVIVCTTEQDVGPLLKIKGSVPLVVESHLNFSRPDSFLHHAQNRINHYYISKADIVVTLTENDACKWRGISSRVYVIPNVVHLNNSGVYSQCTNKRVIFAGRFSAQKGIDLLFDIWLRVNKKHPDWTLDIFGDGELWEIYRKKAEAMNCNIGVHHSLGDIYAEYVKSSMLLLTSIYEPFGLVIPEAMSCGLPVVSFEGDGPCDIITDGEDGFIVCKRDVEFFANRVCQLIEDKQLRQRMGQNAIQSAQRYAPEHIMPMWKQFYESLTSNP